MSTPTSFNQPTTPTPNFGSDNNDGQKNTTKLLVGAVIALLALCGYLLFSKMSTSKQLDATTTELTQQKEAMTELDAKYQEAVTQLEQQKGINAELDAKINEQLASLEQQKNTVAGLIRDKKEYKSAIASLQAQKDKYLTEIEDLKKQNGILTENNQQLTAQNGQLSTSLNETQSKLQEESTAKAALVAQKSELETQRTQLTKKVDIASAIKVKNIEVKSVDVRKNGKEKTKSKAKNIDKLSICFLTEANEVVAAGEETFYIRVVDPTGSPLAIESLGSGVAQNKKDESEVRFTTSANCNYTNSETQVCGAWQPGQDFVKGMYKVEIYNKGYLVGASSFKLK